jgi:hypothetical protein
MVELDDREQALWQISHALTSLLMLAHLVSPDRPEASAVLVETITDEIKRLSELCGHVLQKYPQKQYNR